MGFEDTLRLLLLEDWTEQEKELIERIIVNICSYKRFMSNALKEDILKIVDLCITLKRKIPKQQE
jgi:hypothetical protein